MPADEVLDLVDEHDRVIGAVTRGETDTNPALIHREVAVLLYDDHNRLQQRAFTKTVHPGLWSVSCAGHVPQGMEPIDAAHMELREELGFDTKLVFIRKFLDRLPKQTRFISLFLGRYDGQSLNIQREEIEAVRVVAQDEYHTELQHRSTPGSKRLLDEFWSGGFDDVKVAL